MRGINEIVAVNAAAQREYDAKAGEHGAFSAELAEIIAVHGNVLYPTTVERELVALAKRLLEMRDGAKWSEKPLWEVRDGR